MFAPAPLSKDISFLAAAFVASGIVHLVRPQTLEPPMPMLVPGAP